MATENNIQPTNQLENTIQVTWYTTLCIFLCFFLCLHQMLQIVWWLASLCKMVASLESTHNPYRHIIQHNLFFSLHAKNILSLKQFVSPTFYAWLSQYWYNFIIMRDVHLPLQTNINIFSAVHQFTEESCQLLYHYLFRMTYCIT